jgi:YebC/PmpR family DNA-binding regulatory protein
MSGHSKWATIRRKKGATDAARGKVFTRLTREIMTAARIGGGESSANARLRKAIADARAQQMPNDSIKRAIQRGTGEIEGASFEDMTYEGTGPAGTLFIVEGTTDNRNRTVAELRKLFEKHNGTMGSPGSAQWAFSRVGVITLDRTSVPEDKLMEVAVGAGADDYHHEGDSWLVYTPVAELDAVTAAFEAAHMPVQQSRLAYVPKTKKPVTGRDAEVCLNLAEALDDHDDIQNVFSDFDVSDEEMARIAGL